MTIDTTTTFVHVNRGTIDSNRKHGRHEPVLKIQKGKYGRGQYGNRVEVLAADGTVAATFEYNPDGILPCGARAVLVAPYGARFAP